VFFAVGVEEKVFFNPVAPVDKANAEHVRRWILKKDASDVFLGK